MKRSVARLLVLLAVLFGGPLLQAQTTAVVSDDFESGSLNATVWNVAGNLGTGTAGVVVAGAPYHYVLSFNTTAGAVIRRGAYYQLPAFGADDVYVMHVDVQRTGSGQYFTIESGAKRPSHPSGETGANTTITSSVWALPMIIYNPANTGGDDPFATEGLRVRVATDNSFGVNDVWYLATGPLPIGEWHSLQLEYPSGSLRLDVDGQPVLSLSGPQLKYKFDQADDWVYLLGDGGSHFYCTTNAFFDNVLLMHTRQIILSVVDTFGENKVPFQLGDALYNQFGPDKLQEALAASGGDFDKFWAYLFPPEAPAAPPAPQLSLVSVAATGSTVVLTVANIGDAPCTGKELRRACQSDDRLRF